MIKCTNACHNGGTQPHVYSRELSVSAAAYSLIFCELGFGTAILKLTPTYIKCRTPLFGNYDIVEFTGSEEEMSYLVTATALYLQMRGEPQFPNVVLRVIEQLRTPSGGFRPFDVIHAGPILASQRLTYVIAVAAAGITPDNAYAAYKLRDVIDAALIHLEDGSNLDETLRQLGQLAA